MKTRTKKYWCMGCGVFDARPCELLGHISREVSRSRASAGLNNKGPTTIAATYLGKLQHLKVKLPGE